MNRASRADTDDIVDVIKIKQLIGINTHGRYSHSACHNRYTLAIVVTGVAVDAAYIVYKHCIGQKCLSDEFCTERIARHQNCLCEVSLFCCYMWCWNIAHFILLSAPETPEITCLKCQSVLFYYIRPGNGNSFYANNRFFILAIVLLTVSLKW